MLKKWCFLSACFFSITSYSVNASNSLSPQAPVMLTNTGDLENPVRVSGTTSGFLAVSTDGGDNLVSVLSTDGMSWDSPVLTATTTFTSMWVSGTAAGFMTTFIGPTVGFSTGAAFSLFSPDGSSWGPQTLIENSTEIASPVAVSGTAAGFLATWHDDSDNNAYASFSTDNGMTWSTAVAITSSGDVNSAVIVNGTTAGFLATFQQLDSNAYASFSSDNGMTWSATPVQITTSADVNSDVWVSSNSSGSLATWSNNSSNAFASFSADNGMTWSAPVQIATTIQNGTDISVSGSSLGFVVGWVGQDSNAYGSFSSDNGLTWSSPAQITSDGSVSTSYSDTSRGVVDVSALTDTCVFTWEGNDNNGYASFSTITISPSSGIAPPTNLTGSQNKNNGALQFELFNLIQWQPSISAGIIGYNVYRNGVKVATVNAFTFTYEAHNQKKGATTAYSVTAFDGNGNESSAVNISIK
jgi:hypothetical protein